MLTISLIGPETGLQDDQLDNTVTPSVDNLSRRTEDGSPVNSSGCYNKVELNL